jgi:hypothetical protein
MRSAIGHEVLAGAIGGMSILGGAFTSPLWAPVVDLGSAAVTAGIAAHAVYSVRARGESVASTRRALGRAASDATGAPDAPLAAHIVDAACRVRRCDGRALRSVAMLVGRCFEAHASGVALGLAASWFGPARSVSRVRDLTRVAHAATANADLVRSLHEAVLGARPEPQALEPTGFAALTLVCDRAAAADVSDEIDLKEAA